MQSTIHHKSKTCNFSDRVKASTVLRCINKEIAHPILSGPTWSLASETKFRLCQRYSLFLTSECSFHKGGFVILGIGRTQPPLGLCFQQLGAVTTIPHNGSLYASHHPSTLLKSNWSLFSLGSFSCPGWP